MRKAVSLIDRQKTARVGVCLLLALFCRVAATEAQPERRFHPRPDGVPDEYIVVLHDGAVRRPQDPPGVGASVSELATRLAGLHRGQVLTTYEHALRGFAVRMPAAAAEALSRDPRVKYVEQNVVFPLQNVTMDCRLNDAAPVAGSGPAPTSPQPITCVDPDPTASGCEDNWGLDRIDQRVVDALTPRDGEYVFSTTASGVHAYIFDTGLNADHLEFSGRVEAGFDAVGTGNTADCADHGHGTHVAGILGGTRYGVAKGVRIHPVKIACSGVNLNVLLKGIDWVVDNHPAGQPAVSNLSANGQGIHSSRALAAMITSLIQDGVVFIESAGNQNADAEAYSMIGPEFPSEVIIAGGMDELDARWTRVDSDPDDQVYCNGSCSASPCQGDCASNFGPAVDVWAPAAHIVSTSRYPVGGVFNGICSLSGTSMAAPHVTGVAALLLARFPNASPSAVEKAILRNASLNELDGSIGGGSPNRLLHSIFPATGAPVAGNDRFSMEPGALDILYSQLLAGDFDYDNQPLQVVGTGNPSHGTLQPINGGLVYTSEPGFFGTDSFTYTISDGVVTDTATVELVVRAAPVAVDDFLTTDQDKTLFFNVNQFLTNDSDPDGFGVVFVDFTSQPVHGRIEPDFLQFAYRYIPNTGFVGTDSFRYKIRDEDYLEAEATVFVTVRGTNSPPNTVDDTASTSPGTAVIINVTANDTDPNSNPLTVLSVTQPVNGISEVVSASSVRYTPNAGFSGTDSFSYTVGDGQGGSDTGTVSVTVNNNPPVANPDSATTNEDTPVTINVTVNDTDPNGDSLTVTTIPVPPANGTATIVSPSSISYSPRANFFGTDSFQYRISDGRGGLGTGTVTVTVSEVNDLPVANPDAATTNENTAVTVNVIANDTDVDGDFLQIAADLVTLPTHGTATIVSQTEIRYTPNLDFAGTDSLVYRVRDNRGGRSEGTLTITVLNVNNPPKANPDSATTNEDTPITINVTANDTDPDGDSPIVAAIVTAPANGTATIASASSITYAPRANFFGTDSFNYRIRDGNGGLSSTTVTVTVTEVNDLPVANPDAATTNEDTAVTVNVIANDTDVDGDFLQIADALITFPTKGTATIVSQTQIRYTPNPNSFGTDSLIYRVRDNRGGRSDATLTITVLGVNDVPVANPDAVTTPEDTGISINVTANDTDADGNSLIVAAILTAPANGTATITSASNIQYTPRANFFGTDTFRYRIRDGNGGLASADVAVTVSSVNDPPVANPDSATTLKNTAVTINVTANDTDVDGDTLGLVTIITAPSRGTATIVSSSSIRYTPATGFVGTDSFVYQIGDGKGRRANGTVTVTVK